MFIYITALKYRYDIITLSDLSLKLSNLTKIDNEKILEKMQVNPNILEEYACKIAYYCSVDTLRCHELLLKRNIISDYIQFAKYTSITISNVFTNGVGCLVNNLYRRYCAKKDMLISMVRKGRIEITKYGGGLVIPPEIPSEVIEFLGQYVPIADVDFGSEYPNVIINSNISNDTCVDINSQDLNLNVVTDNFIVYGKYKFDN